MVSCDSKDNTIGVDISVLNVFVCFKTLDWCYLADSSICTHCPTKSCSSLYV